MNSAELNQRIRDIEDKEGYYGGPMVRAGKAFPYIGWFWRMVDFDQPITLGECSFEGSLIEESKHFIGFMENNKWDYDEWVCTPEQSAQIRALCVAAVENPSANTLQRLYDFLQTCKPSDYVRE